MKRKSTLILIALVILAVSIPLFALAESAIGTQPQNGTGYMRGRYIGELNADGIGLQGSQFALGDYLVDEDGFCYTLDANGEAQRLYARGANGRNMYLRFSDGEYCWSDENATERGTQTRNDNFFGGRGCPRWN